MLPEAVRRPAEIILPLSAVWALAPVLLTADSINRGYAQTADRVVIFNLPLALQNNRWSSCQRRNLLVSLVGQLGFVDFLASIHDCRSCIASIDYQTRITHNLVVIVCRMVCDNERAILRRQVI